MPLQDPRVCGLINASNKFMLRKRNGKDEGNVSSINHNLRETRANHGKKSSKFTIKITHVDDMMIHNFVKYFVQPQLRM